MIYLSFERFFSSLETMVLILLSNSLFLFLRPSAVEPERLAKSVLFVHGIHTILPFFDILLLTPMQPICRALKRADSISVNTSGSLSRTY